MKQPRRALPFLLAIALLFGFGQACGARHSSSQWSEEQQALGPGPLRSIDADSPDFFAEQRVEIDWGEQTQSFRAVLQKRGDVLELILLDPLGRPGFRFYQQGAETGVENFTQRSLPFEPAYLLGDAQKAFLDWPEGGPAEQDPRSTQRVSSSAEDQSTSERRVGRFESLNWEESGPLGKPTERRFFRDDVEAAKAVRIQYSYSEGQVFPSSIVLENGWFSYVLRIDTVQWQPL